MTDQAVQRDTARREYQEIADGDLAPWELVARMHDWSNLLLGNGASMAVWRRFAYTSLYATAQDSGALTAQNEAVFRAFDTGNFEAVLAALRTAEIVCEALGVDSAIHRERYGSVRDALVAAVHEVHVPWVDVPEDTLRTIKAHITDYDWVFTTNYDLLLYWAMMVDDASGVCDFFWNPGGVFEPLNVDVWQKSTKVAFLHGGLHLVQLSDGRTRKRAGAAGSNLLDLFGEPPADDPDATPLFVSEGDAADKAAAIRRSNYLTFVLTKFAKHDKPLVVFGHSLSAQDRHLFDVVRAKTRPIAMSVRPGTPAENSARKAQIAARLHGCDVVFYDALTHPLGSHLMAIPET